MPDSPFDLVLYVAPQSPASVRARRNLEALLDEYEEDRIRLVVRDVASDPELAESDRVVFTPTLIVRIAPAPWPASSATSWTRPRSPTS